MEVSPQFQVAAALTLPPQEKRPRWPLNGKLGGADGLVAVKKRSRQVMYV